MKHIALASLFGCALLVATASGAGTVQRDNGGLTNQSNTYSAFDGSRGKGLATNALLAAFVDKDNPKRVVGKNVAKISHPSTGIYCVTPKTKLDMSQIFPQLTPEWNTSDGEDFVLFIDRGHGDCPTTSIDIQTYDFSGGSPVKSDNASFLLVVN
jgi:hypothetical protein